MKLAKYFDDIRNTDANNIMDFEDMKIFNKEKELKFNHYFQKNKSI